MAVNKQTRIKWMIIIWLLSLLKYPVILSSISFWIKSNSYQITYRQLVQQLQIITWMFGKVRDLDCVKPEITFYQGMNHLSWITTHHSKKQPTIHSFRIIRVRTDWIKQSMMRVSTQSVHINNLGDKGEMTLKIFNLIILLTLLIKVPISWIRNY